MAIIPREFYLNPDVLFLSKELLGKYLMTDIEDHLSGGMIIETEAYRGPNDRASHAWNNRRTKRTEVMFHEGGLSYVYLCYGIYSLFNVVTNVEGIPHAILIRALKPSDGIDVMLARRKKSKLDNTLTNGPGTLAKALGITTKHSGLSLQGPVVWIEDRGVKVIKDKIVASPRVGVDYAGEDANLPWRFRIMDGR